MPLAGVALTIIVIVFCELAPKIYAATNPEGVALHAAASTAFWCWSPARRCGSPIRSPMGSCASSAWAATRSDQALSAEELRTVVTEAGARDPRAPPPDAAVDPGPRAHHGERHHDPAAGDRRDRCEESWDDILDQLRQTPHTRLPVYEGELDNLIGLLHMKRVAHELARGT